MNLKSKEVNIFYSLCFQFGDKRILLLMFVIQIVPLRPGSVVRDLQTDSELEVQDRWPLSFRMQGEENRGKP